MNAIKIRITWWEVRKPHGQAMPILCGPCKEASESHMSPKTRAQHPCDPITGVGCKCFACGRIAGIEFKEEEAP